MYSILQVSDSEIGRCDLSLTSAVQDEPEGNTDKVKVECNGYIADTSTVHEPCYTDCLRRYVDTLNAELTQCRRIIADLRQTEHKLIRRLSIVSLLDQLQTTTTNNNTKTKMNRYKRKQSHT